MRYNIWLSVCSSLQGARLQVRTCLAQPDASLGAYHHSSSLGRGSATPVSKQVVASKRTTSAVLSVKVPNKSYVVFILSSPVYVSGLLSSKWQERFS